MTTPYILGKSVEEYNNPSVTYLYALRRTEDGDLYMLKSNIDSRSTFSIEFFGDDGIPTAFSDFEFPGDDYFEGRGTDHELLYDSADVKYEQWKWVDRTQSYYIDNNGYLILNIGEHLPVTSVENIAIPAGHSQSFSIYGENYDINLYDTLISLGWNGISEVALTIEGNITSSRVGIPALYIDDREYINGISIINNGNIIGSNGNLDYNPVDNRNNGVAIAIETTITTFTNQGAIRAGSFNAQYANAFRGYDLITTYTNNGGSWIGYDD